MRDFAQGIFRLAVSQSVVYTFGLTHNSLNFVSAMFMSRKFLHEQETMKTQTETITSTREPKMLVDAPSMQRSLEKQILTHFHFASTHSGVYAIGADNHVTPVTESAAVSCTRAAVS